MPETDRLSEEIRRLIAETLCVEIEEVVPTAYFAEFLGGESLDLIELSFRINKQYGVQVRFHDLGEGVELDERGILTPASLAHLKQRFPFLDLTDWENRRLNKPLDMLTIDGIIGFVRAALAKQPASVGN